LELYFSFLSEQSFLSIFLKDFPKSKDFSYRFLRFVQYSSRPPELKVVAAMFQMFLKDFLQQNWFVALPKIEQMFSTT